MRDLGSVLALCINGVSDSVEAESLTAPLSVLASDVLIFKKIDQNISKDTERFNYETKSKAFVI